MWVYCLFTWISRPEHSYFPFNPSLTPNGITLFQTPWFQKLTWYFLLVSIGYPPTHTPYSPTHRTTHCFFPISFLFNQHFASCLLSTSHIHIFWPLVILYLISVHLHSPTGRQYRIMLDEKSLHQWAWSGIWVLNICQVGYFLNYNFRAQSIKPLQLQ